jgi:hypothetical protein
VRRRRRVRQYFRNLTPEAIERLFETNFVPAQRRRAGNARRTRLGHLRRGGACPLDGAELRRVFLQEVTNGEFIPACPARAQRDHLRFGRAGRFVSAKRGGMRISALFDSFRTRRVCETVCGKPRADLSVRRFETRRTSAHAAKTSSPGDFAAAAPPLRAAGRAVVEAVRISRPTRSAKAKRAVSTGQRLARRSAGRFLRCAAGRRIRRFRAAEPRRACAFAVCVQDGRCRIPLAIGPMESALLTFSPVGA